MGHTMGPFQNPPGVPVPAPGQVGPHNSGTAPVMVMEAGSRVVSISDGSPEQLAVQMMNVLSQVDLPEGESPVFWSSIGSQIRFRPENGADPAVHLATYPTFEIYQNGEHVSQDPQANHPWLHFRVFPYPFGTVPCSSGLSSHAPRCGDATLPPEPSASIPVWTAP